VASARAAARGSQCSIPELTGVFKKPKRSLTLRGRKFGKEKSKWLRRKAAAEKGKNGTTAIE